MINARVVVLTKVVNRSRGFPLEYKRRKGIASKAAALTLNPLDDPDLPWGSKGQDIPIINLPKYAGASIASGTLTM